MADIQSNINVNIDTGNAIESIKNLQRQISVFHQSLRSSGSAANAAISENMTRNLVNSINATKKFSASFTDVQSATESFTTSLEKNKFSMGQYFKYAAGSTKTFGKLFTTEFNTIQQVAESRVRTLQTQFIKLGRDAGGAIKAIKVRPLSLDMKDLATQTAINAQKQQLFNQLIKQGSTNLLNFGKNTQWAGRQLMVGFTVPLTMLGSTASKVFMDMEKEIIRLRRVYGDFGTTASETEKMVTQIKALGSEFTRYGVAVSKTMGLAADAAAMGKTGADLLAQVEQANRLAVLGGVEQSQALETTISVTNAFGVAADKLSGKINFLNAVENQTVTSIEDLTIAIPKAGPVIKQLGGSVEDLAFFLTAMKEGGINASEGANALKSGIASIINPTGKAVDFLKQFNINIKGIVESNAGDAKGMIIGVAEALNTLDPLNRARAIEQLFGKFQFARISTLFQNITQEGTQASKVLGLTKATSEELAILSERELKKVEDSPMFKFQKALEDIKASLVPLGEQFLKLVTPIIEFGTQALEQFNKLDSGVKNFIMGAIALLGGLAPAAIMAFGLISNGIANVIKAGNFLKNIFVRAGQGSSILGQQTQYMTSEQLEAAAAAASLDQAHQNLTQQFTVEEAAVRKLIAAYNDAAAAGARMASAGVVSRGRGGKKGGSTPPGYKDGIISVPGPKGAGDIVPAMLAPGEAVIPADIVSKNRGFIAQMMQDKLPGFKKSNISVSKKSLNVGGQEYILPAGISEETAAVLSKEAQRLHNYDPEIAAVSMVQLENQKDVTSAGVLKRFRQIAVVTLDGYDGLGIDGAAKILLPTRDEDGKVNKLMQKQNEDFRSTLRGGDGKAEFKTVPDMVAAMPERKQEFETAKVISQAAYEEGLRLGLTEEKARQKSGWDPEKNKFGVERAHIVETGVFKAFKEMWKSAHINLDPRLENGLMSTLSDWPEQRQVVLDAADDLIASEKNPEIKKTLIQLKDKISNNRTFSEAERKAFSMVTRQLVNNEGKYFASPKLDNLKTTVKMLNAGYQAAIEHEEYNLDKKYRVTPKDSEVKARVTSFAESRKNDIELARREAVARNNPYVQKPVSAPGRAPFFKKAIRFFGFNKGVVSVPGPKGAGDIIPAMLSPGESVIPAKMSKKYAPLISGMVDGTIPGYFRGKKGFNFSSPTDTFSTPPSIPGVQNPGAYVPPEKTGKEMAMGFVSNLKPAGQKLATSVTTGLKDGLTNLAARGWSKVMGEGFSTEGANGRSFSNGVEERTDKNGNTYYVQEGKGRISKDAAMENSLSPQQIADQKKQDKLAKKQIRREKAGRIAQSAMGLSMAAGAATMVPGKIGEVAQAAIGPVSAFTAAVSLIPGPIGVAVGVLGALVVGLIQFQAHADEVAKKASASARSLAAGAESMKGFAEFAGTVSASEIADRRRQQALSPFSVVSGKTTFGQAYVQSEQGKSQLSSISGIIADFGGDQAVNTLSSQLIGAIATKVITPEQAKSIAQSVGTELNNYGLAIDVIGQINKILDEDGNVIEDKTITFFANIITEKSGSGIEEALSGVLDDSDFKGAFAPLWWWETENNAKAEGTTSGLFQALFDEQKAAIDGYDQVELARIQSLKDKGEFAEAAKAEAEYNKNRVDLARKSGEKIQGYLNQFTSLKRDSTKQAIIRNVITDVKAKNPDDPVMSAILDKIDTADETNGMDLTSQLTISLALGANTIQPETMSMLTTMFDINSDRAVWSKVAQIDLQLGTGTTDKVTQILDSFDVFGNQAGAVRQEFIANLDFEKPEETNKKIDAMSLLARYDGVVFKPGVDIQFYNNNDEEMTNLLDRFDQIDELSKKGPLVLSTLIDQQIIANPGSTEALKKMEQDFAGLTPGQKVQYAKTYTARLTAVADDEIKIWKQKNPVLAKTLTEDQIASRIAHADTMEYMENVNADGTVDPGTDPDPDPVGKTTNPLDALLKRLQNIRAAAVNATGGIKELMKWMKTGALQNANGSLMFNGIEQQLGKKGFNKDFIDFIANAEKTVQDKYISIGKNGIVTLKKEGQALQNLFNALTIGDYERSVKNSVKAAQDELYARRQLLGVGMSYKDSVEAARDSGLAEAIAAIKASTNIKDKNKAIRETIELYKQAQAAAESTKTAEEKFNELFDKVNKKFDADKTKINLDFELSISKDKSIITAAQSEIESIRYQLDDYSAGLTRLQPLEDEINKRYDERKDALDKISEINDRIANQQRTQMSLAGALASGDIAAAAKAAQEMKDQEAKAAIQERQDSLQKARDNELGSLKTSVNGVMMTRVEIETKVKDLEKQIFDIEESRLEPAQRQIDLATELRDKKLKALDDEKIKWDVLKNNIDLATTSAINYAEALKQATALSQQAVTQNTMLPREERTYDPTRGYFVPVSEARVNTGSVFYDEKDGKYYSTATGTTVATSYGVPKYAMGGIVPKYFATGGFASGTDTVPAMLTPGEFVVKKYAVDSFGVDNLKAINSGTYAGDSMYNYSVNVNVRSDADPNAIARTVMDQIQRIDSQRIRSNKR